MILSLRILAGILLIMAFVGIITFAYSIMHAVSEDDLYERQKEKQKNNGTKEIKTNKRSTAKKD